MHLYSFPMTQGPVARWHPLTKLTLVLAASLLAFAELLPWRGIPLFPWLGAAAVVGLAAWNGGDTARRLLHRAALLLLPLLLSLVLVQGFLYPGAKDILLTLGPLALKREGLLFGAQILSRLTLLTSATLLLLLTTAPADLTLALTQIGVPREIAYVVLAAIHLLPQMQARAARITDAQRARGLRTEGSLRVRARALLPLIGPLLTSALHDTEERALALEARAFRAPGPKSSWRQLADSATQRRARWVLLTSSILLFIWARLGG